MKVTLKAEHDFGDGQENTAIIEQTGIEYLGDFAEVILQFARSAGYTYVKQVVFVRDDKEEVASAL